MSYITETNRTKCHAIIHSASVATGAVGAGLCWVPGSDAPFISAVQISMAIALGKVFDIKLNKSAAKAAIASAAAACAGRAIANTATFWIPLCNIAVNSSTAVALTEFVGWTLAEDFAEQAALRAALTA